MEIEENKRKTKKVNKFLNCCNFGDEMKKKDVDVVKPNSETAVSKFFYMS